MAAVCPHASAGTIRHDVLDSTYTSLGNSSAYDAVGYFNGATPGEFMSGTLMRTNTTDATSQFVLTAAHVANSLIAGSSTFAVGGQTYLVQTYTTHPQYNVTPGNDIAIVKLASAPTNVAPISIYTGTGETTRTGTIVGFGSSGTGLSGQILGSQGTKRAGTNVIDLYGSMVDASSFSASTTDSAGRNLLITDFDAPVANQGAYPNQFIGATPLATEYQLADKDSGGALIINVAGIDYIAGVSVLVSDTASTPGTISSTSTYSDLSGFTRVSSFQSFITTTAVPEPGSIAAIALVAGAGLMRRRRVAR